MMTVEEQAMASLNTEQSSHNIPQKDTISVPVSSSRGNGVGRGASIAAVFRMEKGEGESSYVRNSTGQASNNAVLKPVIGEAIKLLKLPTDGPIRTADLGCSIGANTLGFADFISKRLLEKYKSESKPAPELQHYFSDLPSNDFNTLFLDLPALQQVDSVDVRSNATGSEGSEGHGEGSSRAYFAAAVPGSFYERLFPQASLHVVISTWSLHWLSRVTAMLSAENFDLGKQHLFTFLVFRTKVRRAITFRSSKKKISFMYIPWNNPFAGGLNSLLQIPSSVLDKSSPTYNKGRTTVDGGNPLIAEEFSKVAQEGLVSFFTNRSIEMVSGGLLFVMFKTRHDPKRKEIQYCPERMRDAVPYTAFCDLAWQDLVTEGLIDEDMRDSFNLPAFYQSTEEIKEAIESTRAFHIHKLEEWRNINFCPQVDANEMVANPETYGVFATNISKSLMASLVDAHLGPELASKLWERHEKHAIAHCIRTRSIFCKDMPGYHCTWAILIRK